jgi:hypothetical protein
MAIPKAKKKTAEDGLISGPNIARKLDVDPATVRRYKDEGMPCHILAPGLIRYKWSEVLDWLAKRPRKSKKQPAEVAAAGKTDLKL